MTLTLDQRINARMMPRTRAEQALKMLGWSERRKAAVYDARYAAHLAVGERNLNRQGIYLGDAGVDPSEFQAIIHMDADWLATQAVSRTPYPGMVEFWKAAVFSALKIFAMSVGLRPGSAAVLKHTVFDPACVLGISLAELLQQAAQRRWKFQLPAVASDVLAGDFVLFTKQVYVRRGHHYCVPDLYIRPVATQSELLDFARSRAADWLRAEEASEQVERAERQRRAPESQLARPLARPSLTPS